MPMSCPCVSIRGTHKDIHSWKCHTSQWPLPDGMFTLFFGESYITDPLVLGFLSTLGSSFFFFHKRNASMIRLVPTRGSLRGAVPYSLVRSRCTALIQKVCLKLENTPGYKFQGFYGSEPRVPFPAVNGKHLILRLLYLNTLFQLT